MSTRAEAMSLAELLRHHSKYSVPDYQRVYGWKEPQVEQLFSDLRTAVQRRRQPGAPPHFLGTIFLSAPEAHGEAQIADGQQRILTTTMLYAAARDLAAAEGDGLEAERVHAHLVDADGRFKFAPRDIDAVFFRHWVQERGATLRPLTAAAGEAGEPGVLDGDYELTLPASQLNILRNRNAIVEFLRQMGPDFRRQVLQSHEDAINVVVISAPTLEAARNAYASTYTRGLVQAETDKLKSEFLSDCPEPLRGRLAGHWEDCEARLDQDNLADLLGHLIVIEKERRAQHALEADLARAFNLPANIGPFIEDVLVPSAEAYQQVLYASPRRRRATLRLDRRQARIGGHLTTLLRVTHKDWKAPALLACRELKSDPAELEKVLRKLERLAAVLMIAVSDPGKASARYIALIRDFKRGAFSDAPTLRIGAEELRATRDCLQDRRFAMRERFCMPVLLKLNDLCAGEVQAIDHKLVSCEHILPVNPPRSGPWYADFRDANGQYNGGTVLHSVGNLAVLSHAQNRAAATNPYPAKRKILKASQFALSREAAKRSTWRLDDINARSRQLYALLAAHWQLDEAG